MSIFQQPDIRSNTKTVRDDEKNQSDAYWGCFGICFHPRCWLDTCSSQDRPYACLPDQGYNRPPPTKTPFALPFGNTLGDEISVTGTVRVTDQNGDTVSLTQYDAGFDDNRIIWNRTLMEISHWTGSTTFDKGCTKTDPYGSNNCTWDLTQNVTAAYQGALQEAVTSGKIVGDLTVIQSAPGLPDNTTNVQFTCPVCGGTCTIPVPAQPTILSPKPSMGSTPTDQAQVWDFMTFPLFLTNPLPIFRLLIGGFAYAQSNAH